MNAKLILVGLASVVALDALELSAGRIGLMDRRIPRPAGDLAGRRAVTPRGGSLFLPVSASLLQLPCPSPLWLQSVCLSAGRVDAELRAARMRQGRTRTRQPGGESPARGRAGRR